MAVDSIRIRLSGETDWTEIRNAIEPGVTWTRRHRDPDGRGRSDNVRFRIRADRAAMLFRMAAFTLAGELQLREGTTVVWSGDLLPARSMSIDGDQSVMTMEAVDHLQELRARATSSYSAASANLGTIAAQLADRAGVATSRQNWPSDLDSITIGYVAIEKGDVIWPVLEQVLWENGFSLVINDDDELTADRWWHTSITTTDLPTPLRFSLKQDAEVPSTVIVEWAETDTLTNVIVWEGTRSKDADGLLEPVHSFTADNEDWPGAVADEIWLRYRADWLAQQAPLSRRGAVSDEYQLLRVASQSVHFTGTDVTLETETHEALRSQLRWQSSSATAELVTAQISGDVTFRAHTQRERADVTGAFADPRVVRTQYLGTEATAQWLAAALRDRHGIGSLQIRATMKAADAPSPGALVRVEETDSGLDQTCVVLERTDRPLAFADDESGNVDVVLQGVTALDDTGAEADGRVIPTATPVVTIGPRAVWVPRGTESSWSDRAAEEVLGQLVTGDQVTQYRETGGDWVQTRRWDGDSWETVTAQIIDSDNAPSADRESPISTFVDRGTSATWSDSAANSAIPDKITNDTVIQFRSSGGHWSEARYWTGSAWVKRTAKMIDGDLLVEGTVDATAITAGTIVTNQIATGTFHVPLRRLEVDATTTDNAIYDHLDAGAVLNGELSVNGAILQSERVILPLYMKRTAATTITIWFYGELFAPSGRVTEIEFSDGGTGTSLSDNIGEVIEGSWIGW